MPAVAVAVPAVAVAVPAPAVQYNAGLQHLLLHNYGAARTCFQHAAAHYADTVREACGVCRARTE